MPLKKRACLEYRMRNPGSRTTRYLALLCGLAIMQAATPATAQYDAPDEPRLKTSEPMFFEHVPTSTVKVFTKDHPDAIRNAQAGANCPNISTHTDADFDGPGLYSILFGFAEGEIAATSYTLDPAFFPIQIKKVEMVFAQTGLEDKVTQLSLLIFKGTPNQQLVATIPYQLNLPECGDGLFCNGIEICEDVGCVSVASPCFGQLCDEAHDVCVECFSGADCQDGVFCNGAELCQGGVCVAGPDPCNVEQLCDEAGQGCVVGECLVGSDCDDGVFCNGSEICVANSCEAGTPPCDIDACDEGADQCACVSDLDCNDGNACTTDECIDKICQHTDDSQCTDGDPCTLDSCNPANGQCVHDAVPCAVGEQCDPSSGDCVECLLNAECDDGLSCNGDETCVGGSCLPGSVLCPNQLCDEGSDSCFDRSCNVVNVVIEGLDVTVENNGTDTFSVGFRIDEHNDPSDNPCLANPDPGSNAFPTVDTSGVSNATDNWMFVLNCGPFDCPSGWRRFDDLAFCEPGGDWVLRVNWAPVTCPALGACCLNDGTCLDDSNEFACADAGGTIQEGLACTPALCQPKGACCTGESGETCFEDVTEEQCLQLPFGGLWHGSGSDCTDANFDGTADVCEIPTGGCCLPSGGCENNVSLADCDAQGGGYKGDDTNCTGEICEGACCFGTFCPGDAIRADCDDAGGTWQGPALSCDDDVNPCAGDPLTGACCSADGLTCEDLLEDTCTMQDGSWFGPGSLCDSLQCDQPLTGACCRPEGACDGGETEEDCLAAGGNYPGDGTDCTDCPTQACCFEGAGCLDLSAENCTAAAGMAGGEGTICATFICPLPDGACCFDADDPFCLDLTLSECSQGGGDWKGVGTDCITESCIVPGSGACCLGSGQCLADQTLDECLAASGDYQGNDTDCISCGTEACCFGGPGCLDLTASLCSNAGGAAQGAGTTCATTTCPQATGACCFSTGFCIGLTATNCSEGGGLWEGSGTVCSAETCKDVAMGACCLPDESCMEDQTPFTCAAQDGVFKVDATNCGDVECGIITDTEACCIPSEGNCFDFTRADCILIASIPQGSGTNCASTVCPLPGTGACCLSDGNCQPDTTPEDCTAAGGTQQGDGTTCLVGLCCQSDPDCNDSDACNGEETCVSNTCEPGTSLTCDDGDPCTDDSCDPAVGCVTDPTDCDDADACTDDSCDPVDGCVHDPIDLATCDDSDDCTMDSCEPASGCVNSPIMPCCGNGVTEAPEDCDPPNGITCDQNCQFLPTGACCQSDNMCDGGLSSVQCVMGGGTYQGDDALCMNIDCTLIGACCFANGNCSVTTESACGDQMGTYQSDGSNCDPNLCPQPPPGACCLPVGDCLGDTTADDCATLGGVHQGADSICAPDLCTMCLPNPGAAENDCCADAIPLLGGLTDFTTANAHTDGPAHECEKSFDVVHQDIWFTYIAACDAEATFTTCNDLGGTADFDTSVAIYDGCDCDNPLLLGCNDDDDDDVNVCGDPPNFQSTLTVSLVQDNCYLVRVGGFDVESSGTGTLLLDTGCPPTCPADFDGNGLVRVPDLIFLLGEWGDNPGSPADLDGNGLVRVPDLIILLGKWGECP